MRGKHGKRIVATTTDQDTAGSLGLPLPGPPNSRVSLLVVSVRAADGRVAADAMRMLTGERPHPSDARATIEHEGGIDDGDIGRYASLALQVRKPAC